MFAYAFAVTLAVWLANTAVLGSGTAYPLCCQGLPARHHHNRLAPTARPHVLKWNAPTPRPARHSPGVRAVALAARRRRQARVSDDLALPADAGLASGAQAPAAPAVAWVSCDARALAAAAGSVRLAAAVDAARAAVLAVLAGVDADGRRGANKALRRAAVGLGPPVRRWGFGHGSAVGGPCPADRVLHRVNVAVSMSHVVRGKTCWACWVWRQPLVHPSRKHPRSPRVGAVALAARRRLLAWVLQCV
jgi:hypothetical protein